MALPPPASDGTALVTGASSGIGAEFARQLAARGYGVTLVARREARLTSLAAQLAADHGIRAEALACDLIDPDARAALAPRVQALGLRVDVLVNNAGFATGGPFHESDPALELEQVRLLCEAPVGMTSLFLPDMVRRRSGAIVNLTSTAGFQPLPNSAGYAAAKAYLLRFSEAVHAEVRKHRVTVTAVCPGPVRTELFDKNDHPVERFPWFAWIDADQCVREALNGAERNKRVVVTGAQIRAGAPFTRYVPRWLALPIAEKFFR